MDKKMQEEPAVINFPDILKYKKDMKDFNEMMNELLKYNDKETICEDLVKKWEEVWGFYKENGMIAQW